MFLSFDKDWRGIRWCSVHIEVLWIQEDNHTWRIQLCWCTFLHFHRETKKEHDFLVCKAYYDSYTDFQKESLKIESSHRWLNTHQCLRNSHFLCIPEDNDKKRFHQQEKCHKLLPLLCKDWKNRHHQIDREDQSFLEDIHIWRNPLYQHKSLHWNKWLVHSHQSWCHSWVLSIHWHRYRSRTQQYLRRCLHYDKYPVVDTHRCPDDRRVLSYQEDRDKRSQHWTQVWVDHMLILLNRYYHSLYRSQMTSQEQILTSCQNLLMIVCFDLIYLLLSTKKIESQVDQRFQWKKWNLLQMFLAMTLKVVEYLFLPQVHDYH